MLSAPAGHVWGVVQSVGRCRVNVSETIEQHWIRERTKTQIASVCAAYMLRPCAALGISAKGNETPTDTDGSTFGLSLTQRQTRGQVPNKASQWFALICAYFRRIRHKTGHNKRSTLLSSDSRATA
jgi:hypothetical protein